VDLTPLLTGIAKTENIAILVLVVVCAFLCKVIVAVRKEDREDRQAQEARATAAQEKNNQVLEKVADAITQMRITLASKGFKNDQA
jgi:flagellar biosynthesis/type III secretory pathway M-ring protein FliF/YscJ